MRHLYTEHLFYKHKLYKLDTLTISHYILKACKSPLNYDKVAGKLANLDSCLMEFSLSMQSITLPAE